MLIVSSRGVIATNLQVNGNFAVNKTKFVEAISHIVICQSMQWLSICYSRQLFALFLLQLGKIVKIFDLIFVVVEVRVILLMKPK